jgi:hypothetical protein
MIDGIDSESLAWRKSSYSEGGGECVETAVLPDHHVALRDSKQPDGAILLYTAGEWSAFVKGVQAGEFDLG